MISYKVSYTHPHRHFISFEGKFQANGKEKIQLQLPAWRPGRYELGNFSKNIRAWKATDDNGASLIFRKLNKDLWEIDCAGKKEVVIHYEYYASELNAGSSFLDEEQLYLNPVNCFFYRADDAEIPIEITLELPIGYEIACGLEKKSPHVLSARNFDELADCPLIASASLKHLQYECGNITYHIWIQGEVLLDEPRLMKGFELFTQAHLDIFGDIPCEEYHFLFHFVPFFLRHGVEHHNSTVIAMGPASEFQYDALFKDLLGISCHELFHTWNVKSIRPLEMMPYDFTKENYSRLGYVAEGVTTYYGDLLLWRCGLLNDQEWFDCVDERLQNYFDNWGRFNLSVADSSFETWLDGYTPGIPWRKVSIYNEGFLIAMACDLQIISGSDCARSLDNAMRNMYELFGKKSIGYSESDYRNEIERVNQAPMDFIFEKLAFGNDDYLPVITSLLDQVGMEPEITPSPKWSEAYLGLFVEEAGQKMVIQSVIPGSPADTAGLWTGDEILSVNGIVPYKNLQSILRQSTGQIQFLVQAKHRQKFIEVLPDGNIYGKRLHIRYANLNVESEKRFRFWKSRQAL